MYNKPLKIIKYLKTILDKGDTLIYILIVGIKYIENYGGDFEKCILAIKIEILVNKEIIDDNDIILVIIL